MGGADELDLAIKRIARWRNAFPKATVIHRQSRQHYNSEKHRLQQYQAKWIKVL